jgi:protease II
MVFCFPAGCAKQQQFKAVEQICVTDTDKLQAMKTAEDVLGKMHFTIDKADTEQGLIRTKPLPAALPFEFWRSDNVGAFNYTEANLHSIRRVVELDISRQDAQLCLGCNVKVSRLSLPERQISSSARAYQMFSQSSRTIQKLEISPEQKKNMAWIDLGNDIRLATEILKRIEKHVKREE